MSVLCVPPRVRVVVLRAPPTPEKNWVKLLLFSRGRGDGSTTLSPYSLLLMHWLLLASLLLSSGACEVVAALCLSFVCHPLCELLLFDPPPKKNRVRLLLFSRGRGDGPTTLSAYSLLLMHGLLLLLLLLVLVLVGVGVVVVVVVVVIP